MNMKAILFAISGIMIFGGISAYWTMSDMAKIRKENAARQALQPQTASTAGMQSATQPATGTNQQQSQSTDKYADQGTNTYSEQGNTGSNTSSATGQQQYSDPNTGTTDNGQYTAPNDTGTSQYSDSGTAQNGTTGSTGYGNANADAPAYGVG